MDAVSLVSAWEALVLQLCCVFTEPTAHVWRQIATGWVLHRGPATVTGIFRTLGNLADRHWTVYEKFFYRAVWLTASVCEKRLEPGSKRAELICGMLRDCYAIMTRS